MADYTAAQLAQIKAAIASGQASVRFEDGKTVVFRDLKEMERIHAMIARETGAAAGAKGPVVVRVSKGV
jgi:roadblock/LC7 domain-containing protein